MASATTSEGENMSEIQSLTDRISSLSRSVDWWNEAMIWGLAIAAVAAVFVVIATRIIVTRTGQLSEAQESLSALKDRALRSELALAGQHAAEANAKAEGFRLDIAKASQTYLKFPDQPHSAMRRAG